MSATGFVHRGMESCVAIEERDMSTRLGPAGNTTVPTQQLQVAMR